MKQLSDVLVLYRMLQRRLSLLMSCVCDQSGVNVFNLLCLLDEETVGGT